MNVENALNWIKTNKLKYWRILNNDKETVAKVDDDLTLEDVLILFNDNANLLPDGAYKIVGRKDKGQTAGELTFLFFKKSNVNAGAYIGNPSNDVNTEMIKQLQEQMQQMKEEKKTLELENKYKKQLEEKDKIIEKMRVPREPKKDPMDFIGQIFSMIAMKSIGVDVNEKALISKPQAVDQPQQATTSEPTQKIELTDDDNAIMQKSFSILDTVLTENNMNLLELIYALGNSAQTNKVMFCTYANMLLQQNPLIRAEQTTQ